jgi:hypothetical protein
VHSSGYPTNRDQVRSHAIVLAVDYLVQAMVVLEDAAAED